MPGSGSFRGVAFYVKESQTTVGRRQPTFAIPFQDKGARSVDLGRAPRRYSIDATVLGPTYRDDRDALINALEQPGPGLLVHPEFGRILVTVDDNIVIKEDTMSLGESRIAFSATEASDQPQDNPPQDTAGALRASSLKGVTTAGNTFELKTSGVGQPWVSDFVKAAHLVVLDNVLMTLRQVNQATASALSVPAGFAQQIDAISLQASVLIAAPRQLFDALAAVVDSIAQSVTRVIGPDGAETNVTEVAASVSALNRTAGPYGSVLYTVAQFASLGASTPPVPNIATAARQQQIAGQNAILQCSQAAGLFSLANAAIDARYDSAADARAVRDALANALADLADGEPEVEQSLNDALKDASAKVIAHLTRIAGTLTDVTKYTPASTIPVELIAWELYADAERSSEIEARNAHVITTSGACAGKVALEVKTS